MKKLRLFFSGLIISCCGLIFFACNNTGVTPTNYSRLQVINTLAGSSPINFYLNYTIKNSASITFPGSSGYVSTTPATYFFQVSFATTTTPLYFDPSTITLGVDSSYSVFVTGQYGSYTSIFTKDTLTLPSIGKAKIRFVNTSYSSGPLDVTINAVKGYSNVAYKGVSKFIEVPAGTYEFKAYSSTTGTASNLATLSNQLLADGKIYTLYANGLVGSTAINSVFGLNLITNLLPVTK